MNPGEQDQNPFRRTNTGHYFNARSRYNPSRHQSYQQANQNPYPQQYNQVQKPRRSKKPLIISIGIAVITLIIVIISIVVVPAIINGENPFSNIVKNSSLEDLQKLLKEKSESALVLFESITIASSGKVRLWSPKIDKTYVDIKGQKEKLEKAMNDLNGLSSELKQFGRVSGYDYKGELIEIDDKISELIDKLEKQMPFFEKYTKIVIPILDIYINEVSKESIEALRSAAKTDEVKNLASLYGKYREAIDSNENTSIIEYEITSNKVLADELKKYLTETNNEEADNEPRKVTTIIDEILFLRSKL